MKEFWDRRKKIVEEWTVITTPGLVMKIQNKIIAPLVISISALKQTGLETARAFLFLLSVFATFVFHKTNQLLHNSCWQLIEKEKKKFLNRNSHFMSSYQQKGKNRQEPTQTLRTNVVWAARCCLLFLIIKHRRSLRGSSRFKHRQATKNSHTLFSFNFVCVDLLFTFVFFSYYYCTFTRGREKKLPF